MAPSLQNRGAGAADPTRPGLDVAKGRLTGHEVTATVSKMETSPVGARKGGESWRVSLEGEKAQWDPALITSGSEPSCRAERLGGKAL